MPCVDRQLPGFVAVEPIRSAAPLAIRVFPSFARVARVQQHQQPLSAMIILSCRRAVATTEAV